MASSAGSGRGSPASRRSVDDERVRELLQFAGGQVRRDLDPESDARHDYVVLRPVHPPRGIGDVGQRTRVGRSGGLWAAALLREGQVIAAVSPRDDEGGCRTEDDGNADGLVANRSWTIRRHDGSTRNLLRRRVDVLLAGGPNDAAVPIVTVVAIGVFLLLVLPWIV